ncbi:kinase domain containing [Trichoderma arundinaceum]|uniref:Autophagy-related protein 1 n=1 Tax=Trichoderma arundinaceum TaxID=490622 RepID=A0A395NLZ8_TRIAR|nr:kinase domain containing [Trichoderma arundinaceum]
MGNLTEGSWFSHLTSSDSGSDAFSKWSEKDEAHSMVHQRSFASDKYLRGSVLGQGGWSTVYKIQRVEDGQILAGKASTSVNQLYKETKMLRKLSHKHILEFVELHKEGDKEEAMLLITELCAEGTLHMRINHAPGGMGKEEILLATSQIADALVYLHGKNYFHSDIKPRNILVRRLDPIDVALADCADCKVHDVYRGPPGGTHNYWSPEMIANNRHHGKSDDIWALGISLLGMMGQWPQIEKTKAGLTRYPRRCANHVQELSRMNPGNGLVNLAGRMLIWRARERITAEKCHQLAIELLEEVTGEESNGTEGLGIKSPEEFKPISFW